MSQQPRKRTRIREVAGITLRERGAAEFTGTPKLRTMDGAEEVIPADAVDAILERYTGQRVPLDQLYPSPPPAPPEHVALAQSARAPARHPLTRNDPGAQMRVETEAAYRKEVQLKLIHRILMRDGDMGQVAAALGMPLEAAYRLRNELFSRMAKEAGNIDMLVHAGRTISFYDEIRATALRHADAPNDNTITSMAVRHKFLSLSMNAENNKHRFLQLSGFYKNAHLAPATTPSDGDDDMAVLRKAMTALLDPTMSEQQLDYVIDNGFDDEPDLSTSSDWMKVL